MLINEYYIITLNYLIGVFFMSVKLKHINNKAIQSGAALNISDFQKISTNSKMAMMGGAGSFNVGNFNTIHNLYSGNLASSVNDRDGVDIMQGKKFLPKFLK